MVVEVVEFFEWCVVFFIEFECVFGCDVCCFGVVGVD